MNKFYKIKRTNVSLKIFLIQFTITQLDANEGNHDFTGISSPPSPKVSELMLLFAI